MAFPQHNPLKKKKKKKKRRTWNSTTWAPYLIHEALWMPKGALEFSSWTCLRFNKLQGRRRWNQTKENALKLWLLTKRTRKSKLPQKEAELTDSFQNESFKILPSCNILDGEKCLTLEKRCSNKFSSVWGPFSSGAHQITKLRIMSEMRLWNRRKCKSKQKDMSG